MAEISAGLRAFVRKRAQGLCEYCGLPEWLSFVEHQIDHIIAVKHGGTSEADNLALSCALCNRHKGSDIASIDPDSSGLAPLYDPRRDAWDRHFLSDSGRIIGLTATGRATVRLLQLNRAERVRERFSG